MPFLVWYFWVDKFFGTEGGGGLCAPRWGAGQGAGGLVGGGGGVSNEVRGKGLDAFSGTVS